ncbi:hypothetical protein DVR11_15500 [Paracoccus versutus]|nr:hypothetical protein DVR11_15500 [Paracoccus versutus]
MLAILPRGTGSKTAGAHLRSPARRQSRFRGSRFEVRGSRFKVQGSRFKVQGSRFKVKIRKISAMESVAIPR